MTPPTSAPTRPKQGKQGSQGSQVEGWPAQPRRIVRRRTTGDVFKGLGALLVLAVLLGAIPFALVRYIGWPLPHHPPSAHFFNQAITPQVLLDGLAVIVWLAWAQFVACVVVEFRAAVRGIGMPTRVPAAGPSQFLARQLVAALLMITASAASFVPNLAHLGPGSDASPSAAAPVTATAGPFPRAQHPAIAPHPAAAVGDHNLPALRGESGLRVAGDSTALLSADGTKLYRVKPPLGRHHDTLWEIAQRHLGDGRRYREIYELNKDRVQPDGSKLINAALIRPGWILMMPADAVGGDLVVETAPTAPPAPAPTSPQNLSPVQPGGIQPGPTQPGPTQSGSTQGGGPSQGGPSQGSTVQTGPAHASTIQSGPVQPSGVQQTGARLGAGSTTAPSALTPVPSSAPPAITQPPIKQSPTNEPPAEQQSQLSTEAAVARSVPELDTNTTPAADTPSADSTNTDSTNAVTPNAATSNTATPRAITPNTDKQSTEVALPAALPVTTPATVPATVTQSADELARVATAAVEAATPATPASPTTSTTPATSVTLMTSVTPTTPTTLTASAASASAQPAPDQTSSEQQASTQPTSDDTSDTASAQTSSASHSSPAQTTTLAGAAPAPAFVPAPAPVPVHQDTTTSTARDGARSSSHRGSHSPEESQPPSTEDRVLYGLAASPLLAAGLLKAIGRHRRRQLWNRVFGRRPVTPNGDGAVAEESIRVGASEVEVWFLDLALRGLSAGLSERGRTVPAAYAVRLRDEGIELLLNKPVAPDDPAVQPPAPWFTAGDGRSWNFPRPGIVDVDAQAAHRRFAPYPGLVTIGAHGADRLMIDLEEARGLIGLDGPPEIRRAVLASLAVELATNSWSDRMTVTLVGFPGDLTPLAPARVRHVRTLDEILPSLEIEAVERAKALAAAGLDSVLDGRSRANQASSFPPHFVLISEEPHAAILARLATIATTPARLGLGFVVAGEDVGATWQLTVASDRRITAPALGIEAQAQLLPEEQYAAVLGLFRAVCDIEGTDVTAKPAHQSVGYSGPLPDEPPSVYATLLGPLGVTGAEMVEPGHTALLNEALVFLLHHRDGVHPRVLAAALWPRGTTADIAEETFARLNTWLGTDPHGKPNLHTDAEGRLRLGPYVWSDWDMFISLQSRALYDASIPDQEQRDEMLSDALDLVRGPYLADREPNRYGWLAYEIAEAQVPAVIADAAFRLAESRVASGEPEAAIEAVKAGMRGSPDDEELWRGLLRATAATEDTERLRGAIEGLYKRTWYVHGVQGLHPRTEALVNELMPDWREAFAA